MANISKNDETGNEAFDFESANSVDEMIEAVKNMDSCFQEYDLAFVCLKIGKEFCTKGENPEKVITFGKSALRILLLNNNHQNINHHASTVFAASVLNFMGFASFKLKRYDESLSYLNSADRILCKLEQQECACVFDTLAATHLELLRVKTGMGKREESVAHLEKVLSIKEKTMDEGCVELGQANKGVCCAYIWSMKFKAALPFGLKALAIYTNHFEYNSVEVAEMVRFLGVIYFQLGEHVKGLKQHQSALNALKVLGYPFDMIIQAEIESGYILIGNGLYKEAMKGLKTVVSISETKEVDRGRALVYMARASYEMEELEEAKKYMESAHEILEKKETDPITAAVGFVDMSVLYEKLSDFETALSLLMRVLTTPDLPHKLLVDGSKRLLPLIRLAGKEMEAIGYLEDVLGNLKVSLGPEQIEVGHCYAKLGAACWKAGSLFRSKMYFGLAKNVMDVSLGPNHLDSLKTSQSLALLCTLIGRHDEAIEIQNKVIRGIRRLVPSDRAFLDEALTSLDVINERKNTWSWCGIL